MIVFLCKKYSVKIEEKGNLEFFKYIVSISINKITQFNSGQKPIKRNLCTPNSKVFNTLENNANILREINMTVLCDFQVIQGDADRRIGDGAIIWEKTFNTGGRTLSA